VVESFLSKEISCVVSSSKEAKQDKASTWPETQSNGTSEGAKAPSLMPPASKEHHSRAQQKPPDTALISRGKELLQKAMKKQVSSLSLGLSLAGSILARARLWGVQILHVDGVMQACSSLPTHCCSVLLRHRSWDNASQGGGRQGRGGGKLKPPFLKIEDQSRQFRPFYQQFKSFPSLNLLAPQGYSPFEPLKNLPNPCRARGLEGCPVPNQGEKSPRSTPVTVPKRRRGFCECCQETFEELQEHLQSAGHRRFALDASQYAAVDAIIAQLNNS
ncbi:DBF4B protein, partial [Eubucco bourcierii]|nr:DBF4B protein [Eubucco bourcierii]